MDEMLKIAPNGQWSLEKSMDKNKDAERLKQIEAYLARQKAGPLNLKPTATAPAYPEGLRPAQVSTMDHKGDPRNYTDPGTRAEIQQRVANREDLDGPQVISRTIMARPDPSEEAPSAAEPEELMPPQEYVDQEWMDANTGQKQTRRVQQARTGRFHGEGATTRGKVVPQRVGFKDPVTGEFKGKTLQRAQEHVWAWDANKKKWNHVKTNYISGESDSNAPKKPLKPEEQAKLTRAKEIASASKRMYPDSQPSAATAAPAPQQVKPGPAVSVKPTIRKK